MASLFTNLRDAFYSLVPSWLSEGDGGKVLHALATLIDASVQLDRQRTELRFPRRAPPSANVLTGRDRGIQAGRTETPAHYAERLVRWRYPRGHRVRGNAWGVLEQVSEYFGGIQASTIDPHGNRHTRFSDGHEATQTDVPWDWDGQPLTLWARFWITLYSFGSAAPFRAQKDITDPTCWSDGTLGLRGMTPQDANAIRSLFQRAPYTVPWHPSGTRPEWVIVSLDGVDVAPNYSYARWSGLVGDTQEPTRDPLFRYFALIPAAHPYVENPVYPTHVHMPDGSYYDGSNAGPWDTSVTFPDGSVHTDNPAATFVTGVLLPDDASTAQGS